MTEPARTDLTIQHEYDNGWDKPRFLFDHDLEDPAIETAIAVIDNGRLAIAVEFDDGSGDRRRIAKARNAYVNLYLGHQAYGGPEEGGWWYDSEEPVGDACLDVTLLPHEERLNEFRKYKGEFESGQDKMRDYYSVNAGGMYRVRLEPFEAEHSPKTRPHYE